MTVAISTAESFNLEMKESFLMCDGKLEENNKKLRKFILRHEHIEIHKLRSNFIDRKT